ALGHARGRAERAGAAVHFFQWNALGGPLPREYDAVICSLFLHHLEATEAVEVLRRMAASARGMVLVSDLRRSAGGWLLAWLAARLLTTSGVVRVDAPRSVAGAYTVTEAKELAEQAGLNEAVVKRRWPFRWLLTWRRPPAGGRGA